MNYYMIEGVILNADRMNDELMQEHMIYTQKAMDEGMVFLSGLKSDMSGGLFLMKAETLEQIETYLANEPFHVNGIQDYRVIPFAYHYINADGLQWFA